MNDLLHRIQAAQQDVGERVVMEDLKSKGLDDLCAPPPPLKDVESVDDVREAIRRFSYAWQLPISNEEIKPASQDLITAAEWAIARIEALEKGKA